MQQFYLDISCQPLTSPLPPTAAAELHDRLSDPNFQTLFLGPSAMRQTARWSRPPGRLLCSLNRGVQGRAESGGCLWTYLSWARRCSGRWLPTLSATEEVKSSKFLMSPGRRTSVLREPSLGEAGALRGQITPWAFSPSL